MRRIAGYTLFLALSAAVMPSTAAEAQSFRASYSVTLLGLPVARASFDSTFSGDRFVISGRVASAGIGRLFDKTDATTTVEGTIRRDGVQPRSYVLDYTSGGKTGHTAIRFSRSGVESFVNRPEPRKRANWVELTPDTLRAALDPITATMIRADSAGDVCNRSIRFFDGELRADLNLSHRSTESVPGSSGERVTCDARFVPVAGYRQGRRQIEFMANRSRIAISFARLGDTGFFAPVDATVGTQVGTLRVTVSSIETR